MLKLVKSCYEVNDYDNDDYNLFEFYCIRIFTDIQLQTSLNR